MRNLINENVFLDSCGTWTKDLLPVMEDAIVGITLAVKSHLIGLIDEQTLGRKCVEIIKLSMERTNYQKD